MDPVNRPGAGDHAARLLDSVPVAVASFDPAWRLRYVNAEAVRLLRRPLAELLGRSLWEVFPDLTGSAVDETYRAAVASGEPAHVEQYSPGHDAWYEVHATPAAGGLDIRLSDITDRRRGAPGPGPAGGDGAAQAEGEPSSAGVGLLAEVTAALASTLDEVEAVRALARLVVPRLGDWCIVSVVADDQALGLRDLTSAHADPGRQAATEAYARARLGALRQGSPVLVALRTGRTIALGRGDRESAERMPDVLLTDARAREKLRELDPGSMMALPLSARGRVSGVLTLYRDVGRAVWSEGERQLADEVAARAGMALDNARLYADRRHTSEVLQQAMLTPLPQVGWARCAARYAPGAVAEEVGGDWYDALVLPDGALALVIGDVAGHDIEAAALMGQLRSTVRAFAWDREEPPSAILARSDRAMAGLRIETIATAVLARIEPSATSASGRRVRWANAGHPDPLLLSADGGVKHLDSEHDIVLGATPAAARRDHVRDLPPGSTLILYTDGLVERRTRSLREGHDALVAAVARHARLPVDELVEAVVADLVGPRREDDTAVLALRLVP